MAIKFEIYRDGARVRSFTPVGAIAVAVVGRIRQRKGAAATAH